MATEKQLIIITAPFNCGHCARALQELPEYCEENNIEFIEMKNEGKGHEDDFPVETYPTILIRVDEEVKETMKGYSFEGLKSKIEKY
tara:strand:- start:457 stop:717 length:261 start_codon:yes stop_codon:yes gene_type:complete